MNRTLTIAALMLVVAAPVALGIPMTLTDPATATEEGPVAPAGHEEVTPPSTERVIFVGNNWEGTASVVEFDPEAGELSNIATLDIIPDIEERRMEILTDPERLGFYLGIRYAVGEGNDQFVDDMYSVDDGRLLVVSRPSLADVIGLEIATGEIEWRFEVDGQRSDHMAISPDGQRVAVSASTGNVTHILDVHTGQEIWTFPSGDSPHENEYIDGGSKIVHASIGRVYLPADQPVLQDPAKGHQVFQIVDTETREILHRVDMGKELAEAGYPEMSSAVRPMTITPDERYAYLQVSFFHGFIKYDLENLEVVSVVQLPNLVPDMPREQYILDSAHHGISLNGNGDKLCVAGTMSDYVAILPTDLSEQPKLHVKEDGRSYWVTLTDDGEHCLVSWSGTDSLAVFNYETGQEVDEIDVGDHPQRVRTGEVRADWYQEQVAG